MVTDATQTGCGDAANVPKPDNSNVGWSKNAIQNAEVPFTV
jgi:hypothetical protein